MASFQGVIGNISVVFSAVETQKANYREIYEENCHRIYSLSFWMTDNELVAEQLLNNTFLRAFATCGEPISRLWPQMRVLLRSERASHGSSDVR